MVAITATTSASPSLQASLSKVRLEQARREADRAEADAQDLRAQADEAEREARNGRDKVRQLSASNNNTAAASASTDGTTYTQQLRAASVSETPPKVQNFMERMYKATSDKFTANGNPLKTNADDNTVVNSQGQATGRILNVRA